MGRYLAIISFFFCFSVLNAQKAEKIRYEDFVYVDNIKTVYVTIDDNITFTPVISLSSGNQITVRFDDMDEAEKDYYYRLIHCDKDWNPSSLQEIEYIDGFNNEPLRDWEFSANTLVNYTHYWLNLPNKDTRFRISGNYILLVYQSGGGKEIPLFTRRIMVAENRVGINAKFVRPSISYEIRSKHQIDLNIGVENSSIKFPERDMFVDIIQNGNWNTRLRQLSPRFVASNVVSYDVFGLLSFDALNEFRAFDTRSINSVGYGIRSIERKKNGTDAFIYDQRRDGKVYGLTFDFNGKYHVDNPEALAGTNIENLLSQFTNDIFGARTNLISNRNTSQERNIRADYVDVYFTLEMPELDGAVYVYGGLSDFQLYPKFKMQYNEGDKSYHCHALVKQGYHDYMYAHVYDGKMMIKDIEGSWQDTENDYLILTYLRPFGALYDRLVGYKYVNSLDITNKF